MKVTISTIIGIVTCLILITGAIIGIDKYFAKTDDVEKNDQLIIERLDLSITEQEIYKEQQKIQEVEEWRRFEQREVKPDLTPIEEKTLKERQERLEDLKNKREETLKRYNELKSKK